MRRPAFTWIILPTLYLLSFECSCFRFTLFHIGQCICIKHYALQTKQQNQRKFSFIFEVVRGFLARRRCKRLREEAVMNAKKTATFLQYSSVCGKRLFLKQEELLPHDSRKKEGIVVIKKDFFIQTLVRSGRKSSSMMETEIRSSFGTKPTYLNSYFTY